MVDSIHLGRWVAQFENSDVRIRIFPSSHFRTVHPKLREFQRTRYKLLPSLLGIGVLDTLLTFRLVSSKLSNIVRSFYLWIYITVLKPDIVHAVEIQHAGYLLRKYITKSGRRIILTNWGSDIFFFQNNDKHRQLITNALAIATDYSAECQRDYKLATDFGFEGHFLPCIPNAGGFADHDGTSELASTRNLILVKSYGGVFGLGEMSLKVVSEVLQRNRKVRVIAYSVTKDLEQFAQSIAEQFPARFGFFTLRNSISQTEMMTLFQDARIYLGCSRSDGLSTSFLQALVCGTYPIQTNTSCADELVGKGVSASIVKPEYDEVLKNVIKALEDDNLVDRAQISNVAFANEFLSEERIRKLAFTYYQ